MKSLGLSEDSQGTDKCRSGLELGLGVRLVGKACLALMCVGFEYAEGFDVVEWKSVCDRMLALRDRLRVTQV